MVSIRRYVYISGIFVLRTMPGGGDHMPIKKGKKGKGLFLVYLHKQRDRVCYITLGQFTRSFSAGVCSLLGSHVRAVCSRNAGKNPARGQHPGLPSSSYAQVCRSASGSLGKSRARSKLRVGPLFQEATFYQWRGSAGRCRGRLPLTRVQFIECVAKARWWLRRQLAGRGLEWSSSTAQWQWTLTQGHTVPVLQLPRHLAQLLPASASLL